MSLIEKQLYNDYKHIQDDVCNKIYNKTTTKIDSIILQNVYDGFKPVAGKLLNVADIIYFNL